MKIVIVILVLGIIVSAVIIPANASALFFSTKLKYSGLDKDGFSVYDLTDVKEVSDRRDNPSAMFGLGYTTPQLVITGDETVKQTFLQEYTRSEGSKYVLPMTLSLDPTIVYQHTVIIDRNNVRLHGTGSIDGHSGKVGGAVTMWRGQIVLSVGGIPEW